MGAAALVAGSLLLSTGVQVHQANQAKKQQKKANKQAEEQAERALQQQAAEAAAALKQNQDLADAANRRSAQASQVADPGGIFRLGADAAADLEGTGRRRSRGPSQGSFLGGASAATGLQL